MRLKARESETPYYDLIDDYELVVSSFQTQYGIRLSQELSRMSWNEFSDLLQGLDSSTPLGKVISIRAEQDHEVLKNFTPYQRKIHREWQGRLAKAKTPEQLDNLLNGIRAAFAPAEV